MNSRILRWLAIAAFAVPSWTAAQDFPTRSIRWIVPYVAGSSADGTARIMADAMSKLLGQPVIIDNRAGAAGNIGAQNVAKAPPDGYTWVYSASPMSTNMRMYRHPGFDVMKDFIHVGRITQTELVVIVHPESGLKTIGELLEKARRNVGNTTYASGGVGSPAHMGAELMLNVADAQVLHVPYKGAAESVNAVLGKQVDFALTLAAASLAQIKAGKLTALAVTSGQRNPVLPTVPTLEESGIRGVALVTFGGLSVPAGTPAPIVKRIAGALNAALAQPDVQRRIEATTSKPAPSTPEEFTSDFRAEIQLTERMMRIANLAAQ